MTPEELTECWRRVCGHLREAVDESAWQLWLESLVPDRCDGVVLRVALPAERLSWVQERYGRVLAACAAAAVGDGVRVELVAAGIAEDERPPDTPPADVALDPRLTFDHFVIGDSNRLAHAAALTVAELPGQAYNPLFICGPPGLGKTHLLHSIGNYVRDFGEGLSVRYTTVEAFTNQFVGAVRERGSSLGAFKAAYRGADVLLVDDVQFLADKTQTKEEFFHTFNALHAAGAQVVLSSDRLPRDLDKLEDRMRERFEAGLVTDVRAPDFATRLTILRQRAGQDGLDDVDAAALGVIAERVPANIRTLEGALIRVVAFGSLTGRSLSAALAREVLDGLYPELRARARTVADIQERVAVVHGIAVASLVSSSRAARVAWARQVAMYLARELTDDSLPAIGKAFGGRSHTTVIHACRRTAERMAADPEAFAMVRRLTEELRR